MLRIVEASSLSVNDRTGIGKEKREKKEVGGGSSVSPFTLQERRQRGAEGMQCIAQPA